MYIVYYVMTSIFQNIRDELVKNAFIISQQLSTSHSRAFSGSSQIFQSSAKGANLYETAITQGRNKVYLSIPDPIV